MANVSFDSIRLAIESRMLTWDGPPVDYDGTRNSPAIDQAIASKSDWVRLTILSGQSFTAGIGSNPCVRRTGVIALQIFTLGRDGSAPALRIADSLSEHFEYWTDGVLETQASSLSRIGLQDDWYQANIFVPYRAG